VADVRVGNIQYYFKTEDGITAAVMQIALINLKRASRRWSVRIAARRHGWRRSDNRKL
jgi:hypothetical protein